MLLERPTGTGLRFHGVLGGLETSARLLAWPRGHLVRARRGGARRSAFLSTIRLAGTTMTPPCSSTRGPCRPRSRTAPTAAESPSSIARWPSSRCTVTICPWLAVSCRSTSPDRAKAGCGNSHFVPPPSPPPRPPTPPPPAPASFATHLRRPHRPGSNAAPDPALRRHEEACSRPPAPTPAARRQWPPPSVGPSCCKTARTTRCASRD